MGKKICTNCQTEKPEEDFKKGTKCCKACLKQKNKERYQRKKESGKLEEYRNKNKEKIAEYNKAYQRQRKSKIDSKMAKYELCKYKGGECHTCKKKVTQFNTCTFDFHHRDPAEKEYEPSTLLFMSKVKVYAELDKCDLLCSNCHRMVHHGVSIEDWVPGWDDL